MKKEIISLSIVLFSLSSVAQKQTEKISSIYELMSRRDLNLKTVEKLADDYFKVKGTERGSGYKQYQRWLFESRFHVDKDWNFISPQKEAEAYNQFVQNNATTNNKLLVAPVGSWSQLGPFNINTTSSWAPGHGRLTAMAIHPSNQNIIYVGSPGGGLWKSTNAGAAWQPLTDNNSLWMHIFSIAIDPANQSIIYAGTGNFANQVIKSTNGGTSWTVLGSGPTGEIRKILIHPTNSSIVLVAASNGIFRSTNGGTNWTQVHTNYKEDMEFKPGDPNIVTASGNDVIRSTNNGTSWTTLGTAQGITNFGRTVLAVSSNNANYVYAMQANGNLFGRLYLSTNGGASFTTKIIGNTTGNNFFGYETNGIDVRGQALYDMAMCVSPSNASEVHIGGIITWKSTNAGASFVATTEWLLPNPTGYSHCDMHGMEFVGSVLYTLSDGGLAKSTDNADNFSFISAGLGIKQIYNLASSPTNFNVITLGTQDNGSSTRNAAGTFVDWLGADGFEGLVSPSNPSNIWGTVQEGIIYKSTDGGQTNIRLANFGGSFLTSIAGHPTNENIIFAAGPSGVLKSTNGGTSFSNISGTSINSVMEDIAVAPSNPNYIYACTGSVIYVTANGGTSWTGYTQPGFVTDMAVSPTTPTKLWFTTNTGGVYLLTNAGANIVNLTGSLPQIGARTIAVDYSTNENLYVGLNEGVYTYSNNDPTWTQITSNMPRVAINELEVQKGNGTLRAATFGRGIWEYTNTIAVCATAYEPNDVTPQFMFKNTTVYAAITSATDVDRYLFNLNTTNTITVTLRNLPANYNIELRNSAGTIIGSGTKTGTATETISVNNLAAGNYTLRVFGVSGANSANCYALEVKSTSLSAKSSDPNGNDFEGEVKVLQNGASVLFPNPASNELNVDLSDFERVSSVLVMTPENSVMLREDNVGDAKGLKFDVSQLKPGIYFVQILSVNKELRTVKFIKE